MLMEVVTLRYQHHMCCIVLTTECHNSHKQSSSPFTKLYQNFKFTAKLCSHEYPVTFLTAYEQKPFFENLQKKNTHVKVMALETHQHKNISTELIVIIVEREKE